MKKRALQLASVASMIDQFNISNIYILQKMGYEVDVIANFSNPGNITEERAVKLKEELNEIGVKVIDIAIPRTLNPSVIMKAYKKVKQIIKKEQYGLIHCHSPIGGAICRMASKSERKKNGTKVIYTAHGFHFYDGAPKKNWLIYYPIEKYLSRYTDVLITINKEDYKRACKKFHSNKIVYVPGVGVDINKFKPDLNGRKKIRDELGLDNQRIVLLSVGELNENKNHIEVIRAISGFDCTYVIVGKGQLGETLKSEAEKFGVDLRLMGFRRDVADFYNSADIYILPSIREGLNVSLMEAMASGLPCAVSKIRGNIDLIEDSLFNPKDSLDIREKVIYTLENKEKFGLENLCKIKEFSILSVKEKMEYLYDM